MKIIIAGNGGFAREVAEYLNTSGITAHRNLADNDVRCGAINTYDPEPDEQVIVAIGEPMARQDVVERLRDRGAVFHGMLFNTALPSAMIGGGCIMCPGSFVSSGSMVGDFVHANIYATIGHDVSVGNYCTLSSHVDVCGNAVLSDGVFLGSGARVLPGVKVGAWARIGAGAVVVRDVGARETIYAQPGRLM